jgi:biotin carboxyl carrier protein
MVSDRIGVVKDIFVKPGSRVESGDLLLTFE